VEAIQRASAPEPVLGKEWGLRRELRLVTLAPRCANPGQPSLDWVIFQDRLSDEDCDALIEDARSFAPVPTTVVGSSTTHRRGVVRKLPWEQRTEWIYNLLWCAASVANDAHYQLDISGIVRMPEYVEYDQALGRFDWHNDYSHESELAPRKLTVIIQLSHADEYQGGVLQAFDVVESPIPRERGTIVIMPSFVYHRVTQVTSGCRRIIVSWIGGPKLR
jgi:PKHD-type hydroxylase